MDPLTLGAAGAAILLLMKGKTGAPNDGAPVIPVRIDTDAERSPTIAAVFDATKTLNSISEDKTSKALERVVFAVNGALPGIAATGAIIGGLGGPAGLGLSTGLAASAALGGLITQDAWGSVGATLNMALNPMGGIIGAQTGNVGRLLGKEIDKILGGDGKTGTGLVYQATGFIGGVVIGVFGFAALPLVGGVFLLIVAIGSLFSDTSRLAYGQNGITGDSLKDARALRNMSIPYMLKSIADEHFAGDVSKIHPLDIERTQEIAGRLACGWISEMNRSREALHMSRPWGIGQTWESTNKWGRDRGVFCDASHLKDVCTLLMKDGPEKYLSSSEQQLYYSQGRFTANVTNYLLAREEVKGFGMSPFSHLEYWRSHGAFTCEEIWADGDKDAIRVFDYSGNNIWVAGTETRENGRLESYPA